MCLPEYLGALAIGIRNITAPAIFQPVTEAHRLAQHLGVARPHCLPLPLAHDQHQVGVMQELRLHLTRYVCRDIQAVGLGETPGFRVNALPDQGPKAGGFHRAIGQTITQQGFPNGAAADVASTNHKNPIEHG